MKKTISVFIFFLGMFALLSFVTQTKKVDPLNEGISKELTTATTTGGVFDPNPQFRDRIYKNENASNSSDPNQSEHRRVIPYTSLRHADVTFEKRVWRMIDLKEKINQPLMFPKERTQNRINFFEMVMEGITTEQIHAFGDDEFLIPYTKDEAMKKATMKVLRNVVDSATGDVTATEEVLQNLYGPGGSVEKVTRVQIKEDWYFDKQLSKLDVRILAIGFEWWDETKEVERPIFWRQNFYQKASAHLFTHFTALLDMPMK